MEHEPPRDVLNVQGLVTVNLAIQLWETSLQLSVARVC